MRASREGGQELRELLPVKEKTEAGGGGFHLTGTSRRGLEAGPWDGTRHSQRFYPVLWVLLWSV